MERSKIQLIFVYYVSICAYYRHGGDNMRNKTLDYTALTLAIIGAINWGLIGFFDFNLVASLFGGMSWLSRIIYGLVGLCGLYLISFYMQNENARS